MMKELTKEQKIKALQVAPSILTYEQLLNLAEEKDLKISCMARNELVKYFLKDISNEQTAINAIKFLPYFDENMDFYAFDAPCVLKKVILFLEKNKIHNIKVDEEVYTLSEIKGAFKSIDNDEVIKDKTHPFKYMVKKSVFFTLLNSLANSEIKKHLSQLVEKFKEYQNIAELIYSNEENMTQFRLELLLSKEDFGLEEWFKNKKNNDFYQYAYLSYFASACKVDKWFTYLHSFLNNEETRIKKGVAQEVCSLLKMLNLEKDFLKSFNNLNREETLNEIEFKFLLLMDLSKTEEIKKEIYQYIKFDIKKFKEVNKIINFNYVNFYLDLDQIENKDVYKALFLNLILKTDIEEAVEKVKENLPTAQDLEGLEKKEIGLFYKFIFSKLSNEEKVKWLNDNWENLLVIDILGFCDTEFLEKFIINH